jgi:hypothetical protein
MVTTVVKFLVRMAVYRSERGLEYELSKLDKEVPLKLRINTPKNSNGLNNIGSSITINPDTNRPKVEITKLTSKSWMNRNNTREFRPGTSRDGRFPIVGHLDWGFGWFISPMWL